MIKSGVIGIGGVSRSGKSFLAKNLASKFEQDGISVCLLDQDDFVFPQHKIPTIRNHTDWERPESIDFRKFKLEISRSARQFDIVMAEGLMVFFYPDVFRLFDFTIFIELERDEFLARKREDLRWGKEPDWYIDHIWKGYLKYGKFPENQNPDLLLNGAELFDVGEIYQQIKNLYPHP